MSTATVIVERRHLDTDFRIRDEHHVRTPDDESQERARLLELVEGLHPGADHRSYADGAATFLDRDHLIVAFYESRDLQGRARRGGLTSVGRPAQDRLFES